MPFISVEGGRATEAEYVILTLRLSEPSLDAVTVDYQALSGTAESQVDLGNISAAPLSGQVTFAPGETVQTVAIYISRDYDDERDEGFFLELRDPNGATFENGVMALQAVGWALDNDGSTNDRAMAVSDVIVAEGARTASFTVSLSEAFETDRSFTFQTFDGAARAGSDYVASSGTVTFLAGQTEAIVTVNLLDDALPESTESFGLRVTGAHGVPGASGTAQILDPDGAQPVISIQGGGASEAGYAVFTVRLSEASSDAVTVQYDTRSGTAERSVDLGDISAAPLSGTITFAPGQTTASVEIYVGRDYIDEIDESFFLELRNPTGATFGPGRSSMTAIGWALDNDGPGINRSLAVSGGDMREGPGGRYATFTVEISTASDVPITLNYQTVAGTALAGSDFQALGGQITFAAGQTRMEIRVPIIDDLALENTEQFYLRVTPPFPGQISSRTAIATGTATIYDGTLRGTAGDDVLTGTAFAERIEGFGGNDRMFGAGGNDILSGGDGNDTLNGGAGADTLIGGAGNDVYVIDAADVVVEAAGGGTDTVQAGFSHRLAAQVENLTLTGTGNFSATGNAGNNVITGNAGRNLMAGGAGNDTYVVGLGDVVQELANQGYDTVRSNVSYTLSANVEALVLTGAANLTGVGNALANNMTGNNGHNVLNGGMGNDTIQGGLGNDTLNGGDGLDRLFGQAGNDYIVGANGADYLDGGAGADTLTGASGSDTLIGGLGADVLYGGLERDVFRFNTHLDSPMGAGRDRIADFTANLDDIDLSAIDANLSAAGNQTFAFTGGRAAAHSVWFVQQGPNVIVRGDVNGDSAADFEIMLLGTTSVSGGDFLL